MGLSNIDPITPMSATTKLKEKVRKTIGTGMLGMRCAAWKTFQRVRVVSQFRDAGPAFVLQDRPVEFRVPESLDYIALSVIVHASQALRLDPSPARPRPQPTNVECGRAQNQRVVALSASSPPSFRNVA
jgi:hypothetical protein